LQFFGKPAVDTTNETVALDIVVDYGAFHKQRLQALYEIRFPKIFNAFTGDCFASARRPITVLTKRSFQEMNHFKRELVVSEHHSINFLQLPDL
jgi:hypothetical protein